MAVVKFLRRQRGVKLLRLLALDGDWYLLYME